ncbi:hypothetical protein BGZ96_009385 [Linnemannia gamsii]|uniref:Uncharacterized protein n=1 Tax=Linnemannia gamsii TaxID=64522 RepID=A0ABQ7JWD4_9FUNG|nr:hypothetical protein BGZ96_009385 [Linnemannia gamsii]
MSLASPTSPTSPTHPPALNMATKPKRSVSFMHHATVTDIPDSSSPSNNNTTVVLTGAPGNVNRSSFRPGRRPGYVRKGPVQSDSDTSDNDSEGNGEEEEDEDDDEEEGGKKANGGIKNGISAFSSTKPSSVGGSVAVASTSTTSAKTTSGVVRPGQNYVRRAPVNSDTESDEEKAEEPTRSTAAVSTSTPIAALNHSNGSKVQGELEEENSDTDNEEKANRGVGGLVRPMAQTRIAGPGQNYVRKAPVNSDSEDDSDDDNTTTKQQTSKSTPAVNSPAPQLQPPHSGGSIQNRHLHTALGATAPGSAPHSRTPSYDPYSAAAAGIIGGGIGGMSSAMSSPRSGPVPTSTTSPYNYNNGPYTPPATTLGMTNNNNSNSSLGNLSSGSSNQHLASLPVGSTPQLMAAAGVANSMAIYHQQQQEMMMIMQQQQLQIATMQQQQQAYQLIVLQQQQQHQQQLQAVHQQHSRAASANGSVHTIDNNNSTTGKVNNTATAGGSDSDDDVPLGAQLPQLPQLPSLPQFSSLVMGSSSSSFSSPSSPTIAATTITPASPNAYSPRLSVQQSPLPQHNRQVSTSSVNSLVNNGGAGAYLHQPISSSPLNPATSNASISASLLGGGGQHQVYGGGHSLSQTSSQPRLSDFIEEEQERLIREQHLQATAAALGGHSVTSTPPTSFNGGTSLLTSSFPAGYRGSVASVMTLQQASGGIDRGSMTSLHSAGSNGSGGSGGSGGAGGGGGGGQHRPSGSRDSFLPQMGPTLLQQQQYITQQQQLQHQYQAQQQQHFLPYQQPATLIHVEAKPPPPSAGLVGAISAMEQSKKLAKAHGTNQLQFQHQQHQQQAMMNVEKERWLQEQRRLAWEAGQFPQQQFQQQQQQQQFQQQGQVYYQQQPMMMQVPMQHQQGWTSADEEDDDKPLGGGH